MSNRFLDKISIESPNGCWNWTGSRRNSGKYSQAKYGSFRVGKTVQAAHRVSYAYFNCIKLDELPSVVMHTCDNTLCVNPAHLIGGTQHDNVRDKLAKRRDHNQMKVACPHGHPYAGDNLYLHPDGSRKCRTCMKLADIRYREKKKGGHL